jgi:hypothetical protein
MQRQVPSRCSKEAREINNNSSVFLHQPDIVPAIRITETTYKDVQAAELPYLL